MISVNDALRRRIEEMKKFLATIVVLLSLAAPAFARDSTQLPFLPKEMVGEWCRVSKDSDEYDRRNCHEDINNTMTIGKHNVVMSVEDGCDCTKVQKLDRNAYYVHGDCGGEGMSWNESIIFQLLTNDRIRLFVITHSNEKHEG
jgi:hypothetical protein